MSTKKYVVILTEAEREKLDDLIHRGQCLARDQTRARIVVKAADGLSDERIVADLGCALATVARIRRRFAEEGLESAVHDRPRPGPAPKLSEVQTAHLTALACSPAPEGRKAWTLVLLADKMVELALVDSLSSETVRRAMKKKSAQALAKQRVVHSRRQR